VYRKSAEARRVLARRIEALAADVLALQEVESIEALSKFVEEGALDENRHRRVRRSGRSQRHERVIHGSAWQRAS
jgi:hypothetical protein